VISFSNAAWASSAPARLSSLPHCHQLRCCSKGLPREQISYRALQRVRCELQCRGVSIRDDPPDLGQVPRALRQKKPHNFLEETLYLHPHSSLEPSCRRPRPCVARHCPSQPLSSVETTSRRIWPGLMRAAMARHGLVFNNQDLHPAISWQISISDIFRWSSSFSSTVHRSSAPVRSP